MNRKAIPPQYQRPGQGSKNTRAVWFVPGEKPQAAEVAALCADQFQPAITTAGNILSTWPAGTWSSAKTWPDPSAKRGPIPDHRFFIRELREFPPILQTQVDAIYFLLPRILAADCLIRQPHKSMSKIILKDEVYAIVGAAMEVHREKGCGFAEAVYQECMELELAARNLPAAPMQEMLIQYKGRTLKKTYIADFVAYGKIIVELKALDVLTPREEAQVINYLKASGLEVGLLINFGGRSLEWQRIVLSNQGKETVDLQPKASRHVGI